MQRVTEHYWRVTASNPCGAGVTSAALTFTTRDLPPLLLVDDDDNEPDVRSFYTDTLDALGLEFDLFDTDNTDNEPDAALLQQYEQIIWFTGDEFGGAAGPGAAGEAALANALGSGRCLLLSSQDYFFDRGLTDFMTDFLGLGDSPGPTVVITLPYPDQQAACSMGWVRIRWIMHRLASPISVMKWYQQPMPSSLCWVKMTMAPLCSARNSHSTYLGFPLEVIDQAGREEILTAFLDQCVVPLAEEFFTDGFEDAPVVP